MTLPEQLNLIPQFTKLKQTERMYDDGSFFFIKKILFPPDEISKIQLKGICALFFFYFLCSHARRVTSK